LLVDALLLVQMALQQLLNLHRCYERSLGCEPGCVRAAKPHLGVWLPDLLF